MSNSNPLIENDILDTLGNVENHLRFINDYFEVKQNDPHASEESRVLHGLCHTLDMSIMALRYEIDRHHGRFIYPQELEE